MSLSLTEQLAGWLVKQREQKLSDELLEISSGYVLDWLGSALAGHTTEPGRILLDYALAQPAGPARIVGSDLGRAAEVAALVNGGLSHIVEMNDLDRGSVLHPGAVVIPAALAVAEREQASGPAFLAAMIAGYEVAIRIGEAVGKQHYFYFHNTTTCGVFGAAAAAGQLLGLSAEQLVWALGNAGTQAAGLWEFNREGAMSKHLHAGRAAASGILAADLAARGFSGARFILEGERGFFAATAPDASPERVTAGLYEASSLLKICGVSIKPHASCRHTHPVIDAALAIRPQINNRAIERIELETYQAALDLCDNPDPQTPYAAKFSLHYCVASALRRGSAGLADFTPEAIVEPQVRALLPQIIAKVASDIEAGYPAEWATRLRIILADETSLETTIRNPKGDPENALSRSQLETKFRQLAGYGGQADRVEYWLAWIRALAVEGTTVSCP